MTCSASAVDPSSINWLKDGILQGKGPTLTFPSISRDQGGVYNCTVIEGCGSASTDIAVYYVDMERYSLKCITSPAVIITIETNKTPSPDMICATEGKTLLSKLTNKTGRKVTYEVELASLDEAEVTCHADGFTGSRQQFTVAAASGKKRNESFLITNGKYQPSDQMKTSIEKLVQESVDATCMTKVSLIYGPGSLIVYVTLTTTANVSEPFASLTNGLLQNAPRYNLTIEPTSVKMQQG
ncbi:predicted protein [Nematostella vectensis]|uniref:Ig-like domain-containing protein n=1 Tax=Nematostella vectensis TaxID=45351 RepID=A7TBW0_NEMVE|nr:predicted protein [Nematostella vectensis]|eukprot:XP_001618593.1 hypothetical protein NEMVEDRAFT_v1g224982 [Nematostella vectensis]